MDPNDGPDSGMSFDGLDSNIEDISTESLDRDVSAPNYWLGKMCFNYRMAERLVSDYPTCNSMSVLDVSSACNFTRG